MLNSGKEIIVINKETREKMLLLSFTATDDEDYYIAVDKNGNVSSGAKNCIEVVLSDEQKAMLN